MPRPPARYSRTAHTSSAQRGPQRKAARRVVPVVPGVREMRPSFARDLDFEDEYLLGEARGLSPMVDLLRGLGDESAGLYAREPRVLGERELSAMGRDGIGRRCVSIKVIQALAPGYSIDFVGLDSGVSTGLLRDSTDVFNRVKGKEWVLATGIGGFHYGKAMCAASFDGDAGVRDLDQPLVQLAGRALRWISAWDRRDYRVRAMAPSTSPHYRQRTGATWLDLYPYHPPLEWDRQYSGLSGLTGDPHAVVVHPSRYCQVSTATGFSIFQDCAVYIANLLAGASGGASLMQRAAAGVMSIGDWETQSLAGGTQARQKLQAQYEALSHLNLMILGDGETFQWADLTTSGIEAGIYSLAYLLSAATGIPMTILLGTSPGAFVSGDQQVKQWHQELDSTREWLEPLVRYVWDLCICEVTGGYRAQYTIKWNPYETPDPDKALTTKAKAFDLAKAAKDAGFLSLDGALAGLSKLGALDFDFGEALAVGKPQTGGREVVEKVEASQLQAVITAMQAYYGEGGIPASALQALIGAAVKPFAGITGELVQPKTVPTSAPIAGTPAGPGAVPPAAGTPADTGTGGGAGDDVPSTLPPTIAGPTLPGQPLTPADIDAEPWVPAKEVGPHFGLSSQSLASMRTPIPGVMPAPGQLAWLQNPTSGAVRYRRSDLVRAMTMGRQRPTPVNGAPEESGAEGTGADGTPMAGWPVGGLQWRMIRPSDETGVSGTGEVVRGLVLCDGTVVSWWVVEGMPPRPHVDGAWADFHGVHIAKHPNNGTIVEQWSPGTDGVLAWQPVTSLERGPWLENTSTGGA